MKFETSFSQQKKTEMLSTEKIFHHVPPLNFSKIANVEKPHIYPDYSHLSEDSSVSKNDMKLEPQMKLPVQNENSNLSFYGDNGLPSNSVRFTDGACDSFDFKAALADLEEKLFIHENSNLCLEVYEEANNLVKQRISGNSNFVEGNLPHLNKIEEVPFSLRNIKRLFEKDGGEFKEESSNSELNDMILEQSKDKSLLQREDPSSVLDEEAFENADQKPIKLVSYSESIIEENWIQLDSNSIQQDSNFNSSVNKNEALLDVKHEPSDYTDLDSIDIETPHNLTDFKTRQMVGFVNNQNNSPLNHDKGLYQEIALPIQVYREL